MLCSNTSPKFLKMLLLIKMMINGNGDEDRDGDNYFPLPTHLPRSDSDYAIYHQQLQSYLYIPQKTHVIHKN